MHLMQCTECGVLFRKLFGAKRAAHAHALLGDNDDALSEAQLETIIVAPLADALHTQEAVEHVNRHGSHHTDAIITENLNSANTFTTLVDSSAVMVNASTRFNDGGVFGLGAEIGISTDKFHARGPCGLRELTTYKYIVQGTGQIRQ